MGASNMDLFHRFTANTTEAPYPQSKKARESEKSIDVPLRTIPYNT